MTIPPDNSPTEGELLAEVHRMVEQVVTLARDKHGSIPSVRSAGWWTAPVEARLASLLVLSEAWLTFDPERAIDQRFKDMSADLSAAEGLAPPNGPSYWAAASRRPSHAELARRRDEPGPLTGYVFDPRAAARWVATGDSREDAA